MTDTDRLIVRALGTTAALRLPIRDWDGHTSANRWIGLALLATHGVALRVGGDTASRKSGERLIAEAAASKLIAIHTHGRTKFPFLRLTAEGEARAVALVGLPGRDVGLLMLWAVAEQTDRKPKTLDRLWLDEVALNNGKGWGGSTREERQALAEIEEDYLAAASAGWLDTNSTVRGHVRYAVTSAGWAEIDKPTAAPKFKNLPAHDAEARALFAAERDAKLREMKSSTPAPPSEVGPCSLPVAHVGSEIGPWGVA